MHLWFSEDVFLFLKPENFLLINNSADKVIICEDIEIWDSETRIKVKGISLDGIMGRRVVLPKLNTNYVRFENATASDIMYGFVEGQCINVFDSYRKIEMLEVLKERFVLERINWRATYDKLVSDVLYDVGIFSSLGYKIFANLEDKKLLFSVARGRDLTTLQKSSPPVIFSFDYDNLGEVLYKEDNSVEKNAVYAISGNLEINEHMVYVSRDNQTTGINLKEEAFKLNADTMEELKIEANKKLLSLKAKKSISASILNTNSFVYEKDFDLGDVVTVVHKSAKKIMHERITKITEVYEQGHVKLLATFGLEGKSFSQRIENIERMVKL